MTTPEKRQASDEISSCKHRFSEDVLLVNGAVHPLGCRRNKIPDKIGRKALVAIAHSAGGPDKTVGSSGPNAEQNASIFEGRENDVRYMKEFRRVADLNKKFTDSLRNNGTVVMGRARIFTFGEGGSCES